MGFKHCVVNWMIWGYPHLSERALGCTKITTRVRVCTGSGGSTSPWRAKSHDHHRSLLTFWEWNIPIKAPWTYETYPAFSRSDRHDDTIIYETNPMFLWVKLCKTKTKWQRHSLAGLWQPSQQASAGLNEAPFISHLQVTYVGPWYPLCMFFQNLYLVGGFNPSEKYEFVRLDHHPSYWGK